MKKVLIFCMFGMLYLNSAFAHNPLSAMYYFEVKEDLGILSVSLSQTGFQEALTKHYPEIEFDKLSEVEYKQLAVAYVKDNFYLNVNGAQIKLLNGGLKLGNHQTDLKFLTAKLPETFHTLDVRIKAFRENEHHQTIFSLLLSGNTDKVILNEYNDYTAAVEFENNKMIAKEKKSNTKYLKAIIAIPIFLMDKIVAIY